MTRVHIFCEGLTEDVFVREVLRPHFGLGVWLNPIIVRTGPHGRGGVSSYGKIKRQVVKKCKEDPNSWVTTFLDFYGLPGDFPSLATAGSSFDRAVVAEHAFQNDIAQANFIANLVIHEFEGLLFSEPEAFGRWFEQPEVVVSRLTTVRAHFSSPEHINDGAQTAPSKRILAICPDYDKPLHGSLVALEIGLDAIRRECPKFDGWIKRLEGISR
ncbi:DUF4276 family protein [Desulfurivibrio alkaliphilus]|uniref:DUF4276 family protein n=1 Tax=Desulfurivibrio alkaliphilus (strain DSM 19089 / UNIQEM U267 / AHT2) TaxID=589865 RepID=D6Z665_DESAT|nr:DUF4276 family protein [Desulfurivibrio alkaliphilus]ADH86830.1 conserved hypothetical protein [Desulfurivibrio alkaliphilus AHT 2]